MDKEVVRTYLELKTRGQFRSTPPGEDDAQLRVERWTSANPSRHRALYAEVGEQWAWRDRLSWTPDQFCERLNTGGVSVWEAFVDNETVGFFELALNRQDQSVEIAYFGLLPRFIGRGYGKVLLTDAVDAAYALGATRVWLHTCTLDSPHALPNYLARGFTVFKVERLRTSTPTTESDSPV